MVQAEDAVVEEVAPPAKLCRILFRLDDGTTIRGGKDGSTQVLPPRESYAAGLLSEAHLLRVQAMLCEVHAKLPDEGPLQSITLSTKRLAATEPEVGRPEGCFTACGVASSRALAPPLGMPPCVQSPSPPVLQAQTLNGGGLASKRFNSGMTHSLGAMGDAQDAATVVASPASVAAASPAPPNGSAGVAPPAAVPGPHEGPQTRFSEPFAARCLSMVDKVVTALGGPKDAAALGFTVAVDAKLVPDYYAIVRQPIHLGEVRQRLRAGTYPSPAEFAADMRLLFDNCFLYNPAGTPVHRLGSGAEAAFEREWARSPFAALAPPRAPAPTAYDGPAAPPRKPAGGGARSRSGARGVGAPRRSGGGPAPGRGPGGVQRTKSVNSYRAYAPLPADKQAALAGALQDESVLAEKMEGVVGILQAAGELPTNEDGEVELDLSVLTPKTVWALYEHVVGPVEAIKAGPGIGARPATSAGAGFQLAEDSDYAPDDDDDD